MLTKHITYQWLTWGVSHVPHGDLPPEVCARIEADRQRARALRVVTRRIPIPWIEDRSLSVRFINHPSRLRDEWRRSAELTFNEEPVRVEAFGGNGSGPGFGFEDVRIYLNGEIVGRAWSAGCSLGFGGGFGPAVAMLRDDLALRVDHKRENLELVRATEPGAKTRAPGKTATSRQKAIGRRRPSRSSDLELAPKEDAA